MTKFLSNKTSFPGKQEIKREWFLVDANGMVFGRMVSSIAKILMGKTKPVYTANTDCGDFVVVVNASKVKVTGKKTVQKYKFHHTGYPGGGRYAQFGKLIMDKPDKALALAVRGMLPKNKLADKYLTRLRVFKEEATNKHKAQKLIKIELKQKYN